MDFCQGVLNIRLDKLNKTKKENLWTSIGSPSTGRLSPSMYALLGSGHQICAMFPAIGEPESSLRSLSTDLRYHWRPRHCSGPMPPPHRGCNIIIRGGAPDSTFTGAAITRSTLPLEAATPLWACTAASLWLDHRSIKEVCRSACSGDTNRNLHFYNDFLNGGSEIVIEDLF